MSHVIGLARKEPDPCEGKPRCHEIRRGKVVRRANSAIARCGLQNRLWKAWHGAALPEVQVDFERAHVVPRRCGVSLVKRAQTMKYVVPRPARISPGASMT